ncbi:MAG: hypothetical protein Q4E35_04200 [Eubacteriales bacterium]|nr:hypothetical protein [Eubacteriales bacterium]
MDEEPIIGKEQIQNAYQTLLKYRAGRANLEKRIVDDQQWYKLRQWECLRKKEKEQIEPASAWLFNSIANKHADAMDSMPTASILPREQGDIKAAEMLSAVVPVIMDECDFESVYSAVMDDKLISGTGVYGIFWNAQALNGLGEVEIRQIEPVDLFWENGITDIQQSRQLFYVTLRDNDLLEQEYPWLKDKLGAPAGEAVHYIYDDSVDVGAKSAVVDWYYKKRQGTRDVLHYCQFIPGQPQPLFATENEPEYRESGWYDHGMYPFVFDALFRSKGTPCGFGYVDIGKNTQEYIDRGDQAIMQNMLFNCKPRHFIRNDGSVNEAEYGDVTKDFVHVDGALGQDSILPVRTNSLDGIYVTVINNKIDELKETTGNRDVSSGGTTGGATAASAIAAMQEAGSKLSRDANRGSYRAYKKVVLMVIELIRQFYRLPRYFRITGSGGESEFVSFSNSLLALGDGELRLPVFDVCVSAEKASPYSKISQNELALQFYNAGFFDAKGADAALNCIDMMDFDRKEFVRTRIAENARLDAELEGMRSLASELALRCGENELAEKLSRNVIETSGKRLGAVKTSAESRIRARIANAAAPV